VREQLGESSSGIKESFQREKCEETNLSLERFHGKVKTSQTGGD